MSAVAPSRPPRWGWLRAVGRSVRVPISSPVVVALAVVGLPIIALVIPPLGIVLVAVFVLAWVVRARLSTVLVAYTVVLFAIPARYTVGPFAVNAAQLLAFLAGFLWIGSKILPYVPIARGRNPVIVLVIAFFCVILLNYAYAHVYPLKSTQAKDIDRLTALLFSATVVAAAVADGIRTRAQLYRLMSTIVGMGTATAVLGVVQFVTGNTIVEVLRPPGFKSLGVSAIEHRAGFPRVAATAMHPIEMGIVWAVLIPVALHLARFAPTRRGRRAALGCALVLLLALPMAGSRSGFVVIAITLLIVGSRWTFRRQANVLAGLLVAMLFVTMISPGLVGAMGELVQGKAGVGSLVDRKQARERAFALAGQRPMFGQGYGTYNQKDLNSTLDNLWAESSIEIGWIGVGALVLFFLSGAVIAMTARARTDDRGLKDLALTLAAIIVAVAVAGWGLNILKYPMVLGVLYVFLGSTGVVYRLATRPEEAYIADADTTLALERV